jgi:hypothetical protein
MSGIVDNKLALDQEADLADHSNLEGLVVGVQVKVVIAGPVVKIYINN